MMKIPTNFFPVLGGGVLWFASFYSTVHEHTRQLVEIKETAHQEIVQIREDTKAQIGELKTEMMAAVEEIKTTMNTRFMRNNDFREKVLTKLQKLEDKEHIKD